jgi:hypothetical protein
MLSGNLNRHGFQHLLLRQASSLWHDYPTSEQFVCDRHQKERIFTAGHSG